MTILVSRCNVIFVKVYIIWPRIAQKNLFFFYTQEVILFQSDFDHPGEIKNLASESWNAVVIDNGATYTVAGKEWYNCYISSLSFDEKTKIRRHKGTNVYQFGDGNLFTATERVDIPIAFGKKNRLC